MTKNLSNDWIRIGTTRETIRPLHQAVVACGLDVTIRGLMDMMPTAEIPEVKIGRARYTRREWISEWLLTLRVPAD